MACMGCELNACKDRSERLSDRHSRGRSEFGSMYERNALEEMYEEFLQNALYGTHMEEPVEEPQVKEPHVEQDMEEAHWKRRMCKESVATHECVRTHGRNAPQELHAEEDVAESLRKNAVD